MQIQNDQIKNIVNGVDKTDGITIGQSNFFRKITVSALSTGQTVIIPINNGGSSAVRFIPEYARARLKTITGVLSTAAIIRIGNSGSFDNVAALTTLTALSTVNNLLNMTLAATLSSVDISSTAISVDVQTAATGVALSAYDIDIYLYGTIE